MSKKAKEAIDAISKASNAISKWMYDKEELGEDYGDTDRYGGVIDSGEFMVDWLETLSDIHDRMLYYAKEWGDLDDEKSGEGA